MTWTIFRKFRGSIAISLCCLLTGCGPGKNQSPDVPLSPPSSSADQSDMKKNNAAESEIDGSLGTHVSADDPVPDQESSVKSPESVIRFRAVAPESGFDFVRYDDMRGQRRIPEVNGGGVGLFDFDQDGWPDIFMSNGCRLPLIADQRKTPGKLFRNVHGLQFRDVSQVSGLMQFGYGYGCAAADANEDGFDDLYITCFGHNQFWLNNGDGTFSEVGPSNGTDSDKWGSSVAFADLNGDSRLDLYVANYLEESDTNPTLCPQEDSPDGYIGCSPAIFPGVPDQIFICDERGRYVDVSETVGLGKFPGKALGVVICDLDGDAKAEIYVANDGEANYLFSLTTEGPEDSVGNTVQLIERGMSASAALNESGFAQASMGIAAEDFDRDGRRDVFLTHFYGDTNTLYRNRSQPGVLLFEDATRSSHLGPPSRSKLGFGVTAIDVDYDGWMDLIVANGHVDDRSWMRAPQPWKMTTQVFRNQSNGVFSDVSELAGPYFRQPVLGRGLAAGDLDRDGRQDLVVSHQLSRGEILINETPPASEVLTLRLVGRRGTRTPFGTQVALRRFDGLLHFEVVSGGSFQSASMTELHLPIVPHGRDSEESGAMTTATIEIVWPSGNRQTIESGSGRLILVEGREAFRLPL